MNIQVPAPELQSDIITITGLATNLDRAKAGLLERVKELQAEQEDRVRPVPVLLPSSQTRLQPLGVSFRSYTGSWIPSPFNSTIRCSVGAKCLYVGYPTVTRLTRTDGRVLRFHFKELWTVSHLLVPLRQCRVETSLCLESLCGCSH